jgi:hypothetical protein
MSVRLQHPVGYPVAGLIFLILLSAFVYGAAVVSDNLSRGVIEEWKLGLTSILTALTTTILVVITRWQFGMF